MALDPAILKARIDLRICELKALAAWTAANWRGRVEPERPPTATPTADDAAMGVLAMRIMRKIGLRRRQSVKTGHGHMLEPAQSAAPCEDHRSGRAARR